MRRISLQTARQSCTLLAYLVALTLPLRSASAQERAPVFASAFLPAGHWALDAARRLDELGLATAGFGSAERSLTRREVALVLRGAAERAERTRPAMAPLARKYWERFREEFGTTDEALAGRGRRGLGWGNGSADVGYAARRGQVLTGSGSSDLVGATGPVPIEDLSEGTARVLANADLFPYLAVSLAAERHTHDWRVPDGHAVAVWRRVGVWAGRRAPGYGPGVGGGLSLNASAPLNGIGVFLTDPLRLPSVLGLLGPVRLEAMLARLERSSGFQRPWFLSTRVSLAPHPRLHLGATRATMFGGDGNSPVSAWSVLEVLLLRDAGRGGDFENQVISLDATYRLPVDPLPLVLYLEYGFEDMDWFFRHTPAGIAGLKLVSIPGVPELSLGLEFTGFADQSLPFRTAKWYRHWTFEDGWVVDGTPLGHPLGGHGAEWRVWTQADLLDARLRMSGLGFVRDRYEENLFAPDRAGHSSGAMLRAELRAAPKLDMIGQVETERGARGWRQSSGRLGVRWLF